MAIISDLDERYIINNDCLREIERILIDNSEYIYSGITNVIELI